MVLTTPIIEGLDGVHKMSKSWAMQSVFRKRHSKCTEN